MKEPEFMKTSDNAHWMDASVISDHPFKITIIDPRPYVYSITRAFEMLPSIQAEKLSKEALDHLVKTIVQTCMSGIISRRRAWIHGDNIDYEMHLMKLRELIGYDIPGDLRQQLREDLNNPAHAEASGILERVLKEMVELLDLHMNPNKFVVHMLSQSRDLRTFMLEEYADWRVIEFTKAEQAKIDARHEDL